MKRNTTIFASTLVLSISLIASSALISNAVSVATIKACAVKKTGDLRVITGSAKCKKTERLITWGTKGSTGARGPAGPAGPAGPSGSAVVPNVTTVTDFEDSWTSIYVPGNASWETISLMQSEPLLAGNYLVLANLEIATVSGVAFCAATKSADDVGASGTYHFVPQESGEKNLSFSSHITVAAGERIHLRCAGDHADSQALNAYMTMIPVS